MVWCAAVSSLAYLTVFRLFTGLVMLDGYVFAVGGWEGRSRLDSVECYNPHTNTWQFMESVKMAVTSPAVVALDGLLYVTGSVHLTADWSLTKNVVQVPILSSDPIFRRCSS